MKVKGCRGHGLLTAEQVTAIRTSGMTDEYFARLYGLHRASVRAARLGFSYKYVSTPPMARPAKARREWL